MALAWYVARTTPLAEYRARDHLEARGIECFLPALRAPSPRRGREYTPLFPGYLFIQYDLEMCGTMQLRRVAEFAGLVAFDGVSPALPDDVIGELRQRLVEVNGSGGLWRQFQPGDRVLVRLDSRDSENLAEVMADGKPPHGRVRVLLEFLGRLAHAEVPLQNVRLAPNDNAFGQAGSFLPRRRTRGRGRYLHGIGPSAPQNGRSSR
ncbi:MAG: hypothetical protein IIB14_00410 [Chloroflexi bacterium]|nr:hypothetical protein [Chloroflexota bacterium]